MAASTDNAQSPVWLPGLKGRIDRYKVAAEELSSARVELLSGAANEIAKAVKEVGNVGLNFICTHNSRRSHLSQLWAAVACRAYGIGTINSISGGTEATACNERIVRSLRRAGLSIVAADPTNSNPRYFAQFEESTPPLELFSKRFDDADNPSDNFFAMMCCSDADDKCPVITGAIQRVALHYQDPKSADGTPAEAATYDTRRDQIAGEMFFLIRQVSRAL
ncbi:MAG: protein-tyrosine-phosphatase [Aureliella sp.]